MINEKEIGFQCCFCGKGIKLNDFCDINLLINVDKSAEKQHNQFFYSHLSCFEKTLSPLEPCYLSDLLNSTTNCKL